MARKNLLVRQTLCSWFASIALGASCAVFAHAQSANDVDDELHAVQAVLTDSSSSTSAASPKNEAPYAVPPETREGEKGEAKPPSDHVAPPPPAHPFDTMPMAAMNDVMNMHDDAPFSMLMIDRLERDFPSRDASTNWNARAWFGGDSNKLWLKTEGERVRGETEDADIEALWGHAIAPFWDGLLGVRHDFGGSADRTWLAIGAQGLAPYWLDVEATAYFGDGGLTALRIEADHDQLLTQRLILQPRFEVNAYGKSDPETGIGAGISDAELGLRLRYEIRREFAPYIGVEWRRAFGASANFARERGDEVFDTQFVAGVRVWF